MGLFDKNTSISKQEHEAAVIGIKTAHNDAVVELKAAHEAALEELTSKNTDLANSLTAKEAELVALKAENESLKKMTPPPAGDQNAQDQNTDSDAYQMEDWNKNLLRSYGIEI